ncbi:MAG: hypothetical protein HQL30_09675 [Candidatus Omnitrophica bacterium]|nr:hypothetical protein [Candidatus Omnitrophota bacterium]
MKKIIMVILAVVAVISADFSRSSAFAVEEKPAISKVIAFYFHGSFRCPTCRKLEAYSKETISTNFKYEIDSGKLEFKEVNTEEKGNEHFVDEYQLYTKTLILSLVKDGKEVKWKNLDKIWELVGNKKKYADYVTNAVSDLLKEAQ